MAREKPLILVVLEAILSFVGHACALCALPFHLFAIFTQKFACCSLFGDQINYLFYFLFWPFRFLCYMLLVPLFLTVPAILYGVLRFALDLHITIPAVAATAAAVATLIGCIYIPKKKHLKKTLGVIVEYKMFQGLEQAANDLVGAVCFLVSLASIIRIPALCIAFHERKNGNLRKQFIISAVMTPLDVVALLCFCVVLVTMWRVPTVYRRCRRHCDEQPNVSTAHKLAFHPKIRLIPIATIVELVADIVFTILLLFTVIVCFWRIPSVKRSFAAAAQAGGRVHYHKDSHFSYFGYDQAVMKQFGLALLDLTCALPLIPIVVTLYRVVPMIKICMDPPPYKRSGRHRRFTIWMEFALVGMDLFAVVCMIPITLFFLRFPRTIATIIRKRLTFAYWRKSAARPLPTPPPPPPPPPPADAFGLPPPIEALPPPPVPTAAVAPRRYFEPTEPDAHLFIYLQALKSFRDFAFLLFAVFASIFIWRFPFVVKNLWKNRCTKYWHHLLNKKQRFECVKQALNVFIDIADMPIVAVSLLLLLTGWRAKEYIKAATGSRMVWRIQTAVYLALWLADIFAVFCCIFVFITGVRAPSLVKKLKQRWLVQSDGPDPMITNTSFNILQSTHGLTLAVRGNKDPAMKISHVSLMIEGDDFWNAVKEMLGSTKVSLGKSLLPFDLDSTMINLHAVSREDTECSFVVILGAQGKIKVRTEKITNFLSKVKDLGDPALTITFSYLRTPPEGGNTRRGTLFAYTAKPSEMLQQICRNSPRSSPSTSFSNSSRILPASSNQDIDVIDLHDEDSIAAATAVPTATNNNNNNSNNNNNTAEFGFAAPISISSQFSSFQVLPEFYPSHLASARSTDGRARTWHIIVFKETLNAFLDLPFPALAAMTLWRCPLLLYRVYHMDAGTGNITNKRRLLVLKTLARTALDILCFPLVMVMIVTVWRIPMIVRATAKFDKSHDDEHLMVFSQFFDWCRDIPFALVALMVLCSWRCIGFGLFLFRQSGICGLKSPISSFYMDVKSKKDEMMQSTSSSSTTATTVAANAASDNDDSAPADYPYYNVTTLPTVDALFVTYRDCTLLGEVRQVILWYGAMCLGDILAAIASICLLATLIRIPHALTRCRRSFGAAKDASIAAELQYQLSHIHILGGSTNFYKFWFSHSMAIHSSIYETFGQLISDVFTMLLVATIFCCILHVGCFFKKMHQMRLFGAWKRWRTLGEGECPAAGCDLQMFNLAVQAKLRENEDDSMFPSLTPLRPIIAMEALDSIRNFYHVLLLPLKLVGVLFLPAHLVSYKFVRNERKKMDTISKHFGRFRRLFPNWIRASEHPELRFDCIFAEYPVQVTELLLKFQQELFPKDETTDRCVDIIRHALARNNMGRVMGAQHSAYFTVLFYPLEWVVEICECRRTFWAMHEFAIAFLLFGVVTIVNELALLLVGINYAFAFVCTFGSPLWQHREKFRSWRHLTQLEPLEQPAYLAYVRGSMCFFQMLTLPGVIALQAGMLIAPILVAIGIYGPSSLPPMLAIVQVAWVPVVAIAWITSRRMIFRNFPYYSPFWGTYWAAKAIRRAYESILVTFVVWCYENRRTCGCMGELLMFPVVIVWTGWPNIIIACVNQPLAFIGSAILSLMFIYWATRCIKKNWKNESLRPGISRKKSLVEHPQRVEFDAAAWQEEMAGTATAAEIVV